MYKLTDKLSEKFWWGVLIALVVFAWVVVVVGLLT